MCGQEESAMAVIGRTSWRGSGVLENSQNDAKIVECQRMFNLPILDRGGWGLSGAWDRANIPVNVQSRMAQGAAWASPAPSQPAQVFVFYVISG